MTPGLSLLLLSRNNIISWGNPALPSPEAPGGLLLSPTPAAPSLCSPDQIDAPLPRSFRSLLSVHSSFLIPCSISFFFLSSPFSLHDFFLFFFYLISYTHFRYLLASRFLSFPSLFPLFTPLFYFSSFLSSLSFTLFLPFPFLSTSLSASLGSVCYFRPYFFSCSNFMSLTILYCLLPLLAHWHSFVILIYLKLFCIILWDITLLLCSSSVLWSTTF